LNPHTEATQALDMLDKSDSDSEKIRTRLTLHINYHATSAERIRRCCHRPEFCSFNFVTTADVCLVE